MKIKGLSILVTGGAGFIGAHTAKRLHELGANVVVVDNFNSYYSPRLKRSRMRALFGESGIKVYRADVSNRAAMDRIFKAHRFDMVCHQAAQAGVRYSLTHPFVYERANILGTLTLLELCVKYAVRGFVYASSSSVYGERERMPLRESDITDFPVSLYAATKKSCELLAFAYHHMYGLHTTGLRYFTVYGPWGRPDMALIHFTESILSGKKISLFNRGNMLRDFTYVDDIVDGIIRAIQKNFPCEVFNLGAGKPVELHRVVALLERHVGKKALVEYAPHQKGDVTKTYADISKAGKKLGWKPKTSFDEGFRNLVGWYMSWRTPRRK